MNIYDISEAAGVSIASVSRVINGADNVSEKTRQKVLEVIEQMGYTPNAYARGLGRGSMKTIGIMCSDSSDIYLANAIYYLETKLRENGYNSILCCTGYDLENKKASFELLRSRQVDAVIMAGSKYVEMNDADNAYILEGAREHPVVIVNGYLPGENVYGIVCDDRSGMADAVQKLCGSGVQKLLYIYSSDSYSGRNKNAGVREGWEQAGMPDHDLRVVKGVKHFSDIAETLEEQYSREPFDAVIASSDTSGVGALKFALRRGLRVPEDLQIVSYNNSILAESTNPELTSMDGRLSLLCEKAVQLLLRLLNPCEQQDGMEEEDAIPARSIVRPVLVERGTTCFKVAQAAR